MKRRGFTLVELLVVIAIIGILVAMLIPAVQQVREAARRTACVNKLRQIGLATLSFEGTHQAFPPARLHPKANPVPPYHLGDSQPSWLARILPFLEQESLYQEWDLSKPYSWHASDVTSKALEIYICPSRRSLEESVVPDSTQTIAVSLPCGCGGNLDVNVVGGATGDFAGNHGDLSPGSVGASTDYYYGGNGTGVIISSQAVSRQIGRGLPHLDWIDRIENGSLSDGTSNTILAGELHVTKENLNKIPFNGPVFNGEDLAAFARVGGPGVPLLGPTKNSPTGILGFGSWHPEACNFVYADGSTHSLENSIDTVSLGKLCNRADGQPLTE